MALSLSYWDFPTEHNTQKRDDDCLLRSGSFTVDHLFFFDITEKKESIFLKLNLDQSGINRIL